MTDEPFLFFKETGTPMVGSAFADWRKDWHSYVVLPEPPPWPPLPDDFFEDHATVKTWTKPRTMVYR